MTGIYKITNPLGRIYIGQSVDIERRFCSYNHLRHCSQQHKLYRSFLKYSVLSHIFEILEECDEEQLNERERYWQDYFNVLSDTGLNLKLTKTTDRSGRMSKESVIKRITNTDFKARTLNTDYKLISEKRVANTDFKARSLNTDYKQRTLNTDYKKRTVNTDYEQRTLNFDYVARSKKLTKPVLQFTKDNSYIREWESIKEAGEKLDIARTGISLCCKGIQKSAGGFTWKYKV